MIASVAASSGILGLGLPCNLQVIEGPVLAVQHRLVARVILPALDDDIDILGITSVRKPASDFRLFH